MSQNQQKQCLEVSQYDEYSQLEGQMSVSVTSGDRSLLRRLLIQERHCEIWEHINIRHTS